MCVPFRELATGPIGSVAGVRYANGGEGFTESKSKEQSFSSSANNEVFELQR